ncbi:MAG: hypothetical protein HQ522_12255 [Bacteroidetes bacterium]|nr:hypothetical protein [Bacteroidota bacterium]
MKTKQFILAILALVFTANVFATEIPEMNIIPLKDTKTLIAVSQTAPAINEISITSEEGRVVYFKKTKKEIASYRQIFDLSQLEDGAYEVKLKVGSAIVKRGLEIDNGTISVQEQKTALAPYFCFDNNILKVSYLNFQKEDVQVKVYSDRELIHTSKLGNEFSIHRGLDLSKLDKGDYTVMLADAGNKYWFSVTK